MKIIDKIREKDKMREEKSEAMIWYIKIVKKQ